MDSSNQEVPQNQDESPEQQVQQVQQQSVICQTIRRPIRTITTTGHIATIDTQEIERETVVEQTETVIQNDDDKTKEENQEYDTVSEGR